ncbi:MAG: metalloregulator ArsR/SmtB family transcription factor [Bacteroidales bacterium]
MVKSKSDNFDKNMISQALLFKALAHPARIAILKYLAEIKTCITGDIAEELPLSRTTVNQHLAELKKAGLIKGTIEGSKTKYCLNPENIKSMKKMADDFFESIEIDFPYC